MKKIFISAVILMFSILFPFCTYAGEGYRETLYLGEFEVDNVVEYDTDLMPLLSGSNANPDWLANGSRNFYNYIETVENGTEYQAFYNKIYSSLYSYTMNKNAVTGCYTFNSLSGSAITANYICININDFTDLFSTGNYSVHDIYNSLLQDNPQFFFNDRYTVTLKSNGNSYFAFSVAEDYLDGADRAEEVYAISEGIAEYDEIIDMNMSNYAIEKKVHDKLILDNSYALDSSGSPVDSYYAHNIAGSLNSEYGGGVCESYAEAFQLLLNRYNVPCWSVSGYANNGTSQEAHEWNYVMLGDGEYYCVDVTWDDPVSNDGSKYLRYSYFNMPYSKFYADRNNSLTYLSEALPTPSDSYVYYTASANTYVNTIDGNKVYQSPDVSEDETRTVITTETVTETTTQSVYEVQTEVTTGKSQFIADSSKRYVIVKEENGLWDKGQFTNSDGYFAYSYDDKAKISIVTDVESTLSFAAGIIGNDGYGIDVYIDDTLYISCTEHKYYSIKVPAGTHKISWVFNKNGNSCGILYNINVSNIKGDANDDGKLDISDAISMLKLRDMSQIDAFIYDYDGDGVVSSKDAAKLLSEIFIR